MIRPKLAFDKLLEPKNRGILLDLIVFVLNLTLMVAITRLSRDLVEQAEVNVSAKALIGLYFAGLFFLQPIGPVLKRWSFHEENKYDGNSALGCFLTGFMFCYLVMMVIISGVASIMLTEVMFEPGTEGETVGPILVLFGVFWSFVNAVFIYRYFVRPKKRPRWQFLSSPQAAMLGDVFMFLNVISLQVLWNNLTAAESFWRVLLGTPLGRAGSFSDILGRLIVISTLALLVYLPARIFYLAENKGRKVVWFTMLLANSPLLVRAILSAPR